MTIIWTDLNTINLLSREGEGEFEISAEVLSSQEEIIKRFRDIVLSPPKNEGIFPDPHDLSKMASVLSRLSEEIAWQLRVLGEACNDPVPAGSQLDERLVFMYQLFQDLHEDLRDRIDGKIREELSLVSDKSKINLGSGDFPIDGWLNLDVGKSPVSWNVVWGLPFETGSVDFVYSAYLIEHLGYKAEVLSVLKEVLRILREGGIFRVCVPNIRPFVQAWLENDTTFFGDVERKWGFSFGGTLLEKVLNYCGVGHRPGVLDDHKFGYDAPTFEALLVEAGFREIRASSFMGSDYPDLQVDLNPLMQESYKGSSLSLIYEARK